MIPSPSCRQDTGLTLPTQLLSANYSPIGRGIVYETSIGKQSTQKNLAAYQEPRSNTSKVNLPREECERETKGPRVLSNSFAVRSGTENSLARFLSGFYSPLGLRCENER